MDATQGIAARFVWHPEFAGRLLHDVREELINDITSDQKSFELAMEAAEAKEDDVLASIIRLEKRWSPFDLNWAESDPGKLADRILQWYWEQEKRQELFPYSQVRDAMPDQAPSIPAAQASWLGWLRRLLGNKG